MRFQLLDCLWRCSSQAFPFRTHLRAASFSFITIASTFPRALPWRGIACTPFPPQQVGAPAPVIIWLVCGWFPLLYENVLSCAAGRSNGEHQLPGGCSFCSSPCRSPASAPPQCAHASLA